ncbi:MAG: hypothetical protein AB1568_01685 [Thermodesulfobacteriota bacterium]
MEQIIDELRKVLRFKDTTELGDIVLVVMEKPQAVFYARVADLQRDTAKRDEWWHLTLDILSVPPQRVTWILREAQFSGREVFTMGGEKRFIQAVDFGELPRSGGGKGSGPKGRDAGKARLRLVK